jgi:hypothetical protein
MFSDAKYWMVGSISNLVAAQRRTSMAQKS